MYSPVMWIRIRMFLDLPDPDPVIICTDPDLDPVLPSSSKNSKKNLEYYCFVTSL
jgi:hypothetical protein